MIIVGIDIASQKHDYFMIQRDTGVVFSSSSVTIPNNEHGYKKLHSDKFSPYTSTLYHKQMLKSLPRKRFFIVDEYRIAKLALNNLVQITFPELKSLFSNIYCESAIAILQEYGTPKKLAKAHISKVSSLLHGRCRCSASDIIEAAKHSVGVSDDCYAFEIMDAIENLEFIQHRIEKYDIQIKQLVDELCPNLLTVPGIGYVTAGLTAGEIGDAERFHNAESLISFSGVDVTVYESGNYKAKHLIPSKKGSRYLRYVLFQVARIILMHDPVFKAYYEKKLAEGKHYYVILEHIQKKLCRLV